MKFCVLSTADWDSPIWTNKQHIALRLQEKGHEVTYIESLGLRAPTLSFRDLRRLLSKLRRTKSRKEFTEGPRVVSPKVVPLHRFRLLQRLNHFMLRKQIARVCDRDATLYTFSPVTYGIESSFASTIYHSVDLLHNLPHIPGKFLQESERRLIEYGAAVCGSSRIVVDHLKEQGADRVVYWPNVGDVSLFAKEWSPERDKEVLFAGNLTPTKILVDWLERLVDNGLSLEVAGPIGIDGAGGDSVLNLLQRSGVTYHGVLSQSELARLAGRCKVGVIPYVINSYTSGVFPMKVVEYLSAGLQVVSTSLPSLRDEKLIGVELHADSWNFVSATYAAVHGWSADIGERNLESARTRSWDSRIREIEELAANLLPTVSTRSLPRE